MKIYVKVYYGDKLAQSVRFSTRSSVTLTFRLNVFLLPSIIVTFDNKKISNRYSMKANTGKIVRYSYRGDAMIIPVVLGNYKISILVELRDSRGVIKLSPASKNAEEYYCQCLIYEKKKNNGRKRKHLEGIY